MPVPLMFEQTFRPVLGELARYGSTRELERSSLYRKLKSDIDQILGKVWYEEFAKRPSRVSETIHAVAWNIERGICLEGVIGFLREHPSLAGADLLLLSELDWGMAR